MNREIRFELNIEASAAVVWEVVSDLDRYREWNPFVIRASSTCEVGAPIMMKVQMFRGFAQAQTETITEFTPPRTISWGLVGRRRWALSSRRCQLVTPDGQLRSRYLSEFKLSGGFAPVVMAVLGGRLEAGFCAMSAAVKRRAEELQRLI